VIGLRMTNSAAKCTLFITTACKALHNMLKKNQCQLPWLI